MGKTENLSDARAWNLELGTWNLRRDSAERVYVSR